MADSDVPEAIQAAQELADLVSPTASDIWRVLHGYTPEAMAAAVMGSAGGGGGGASAGVMLQMDDIDVHAAGDYPFLWTGAVDNVWDFNTLGSVPAELGLSSAIDGTDSTITATEDGFWSFTYIVRLSGSSSNIAAVVADGTVFFGQFFVPTPGDKPNTTASAIFTTAAELPIGAQLTPKITTISGSGTATCFVQLIIVRLG